MFSSIRTVLFKALTNLIKYFKVVISKEDFTLFIIINNIFRFVNLYKKDISIICNSKC